MRDAQRETQREPADPAKEMRRFQSQVELLIILAVSMIYQFHLLRPMKRSKRLRLRIVIQAVRDLNSVVRITSFDFDRSIEMAEQTAAAFWQEDDASAD